MTSGVATRTGGTTSPTSSSELIGLTRLILDNCGIAFGQNKIVRLVRRFKERAPHAGGHVYFQYLANAVNLSVEQRHRALADPGIARAITYSDPTGETAVNNVMRRRNPR